LLDAPYGFCSGWLADDAEFRDENYVPATDCERASDARFVDETGRTWPRIAERAPEIEVAVKIATARVVASAAATDSASRFARSLRRGAS
jgi:ribosomal protein S16